MTASRILYLTFEHPADAGGGLATYMGQVIRMSNACGRRALVLDVNTRLPAGQQKTTFHGSVEVISWNPVGAPVFADLGHWPAVSYCVADKILELIQGGRRFDCIESCDGFALAYFAIHRKLAGEPVFVDQTFCITAHTPISMIEQWSGSLNYQIPEYWTGQMERFCLLAADHVVSPSRFLVDELRAWGVVRDDIRVIRNPYTVPGSSARSGTALAGSPSRPALDEVPAVPTGDAARGLDAAPRPYYLAASRVQHFKGTPELIAGFERYWEAGGTSRLVVAGADTHSVPLGRSLTAALRDRHAKRIEAGLLEFAGLVDAPRLLPLRLGARALMHPSLKENFPYTVIEQMALGGLVAVSRHGGQAEIVVDRESGFVFDPHDPRAIAELVAQIDALRPAERAAIGAKAVDVVHSECDPVAICERKYAVFATRRPLPDRYPFLRGRSTVVARDAGAGEQEGLLSVVVPHFNLPEFLPETIDSVLASVDVDLEIVVVDDGSTNQHAVEVAVAQTAKDPRVRLLRKPNSGVAETRNFGVEAARGEFIALLDADDLVSPTYYAACLRVLRLYPNVGFVGSWNEDFNEKGRVRLWPTFNPEPPTQFIYNSTNCQGIVVRRQAFLAHGRHDRSLNMFLDDWESTIAMMAADVRGVMLAHPLFHYRIRGDSIFRSRQALWHSNYERILRKHAELVREHAVDALLFLNQNGPNTLYHNPTFPSGLPNQPFPGLRRIKYASPGRQALSDLARVFRDWRRMRRHMQR